MIMKDLLNKTLHQALEWLSSDTMRQILDATADRAVEMGMSRSAFAMWAMQTLSGETASKLVAFYSVCDEAWDRAEKRHTDKQSRPGT